MQTGGGCHPIPTQRFPSQAFHPLAETLRPTPNRYRPPLPPRSLSPPSGSQGGGTEIGTGGVDPWPGGEDPSSEDAARQLLGLQGARGPPEGTRAEEDGGENS